MPQKGFVGLIQTAGKEQRMNLGATANSWIEIRLWRIHKELRNKKQKQQMQTTHLSFLLFQCISANLVLFAFLYSWDSVQFSCSVMSDSLHLLDFIDYLFFHVGEVSNYQFSSVAQSCPTLCNPMNHSMPGLPIHHQLLDSTQTHVHWVSDAIQPSHLLLSPSPPALNPSQHQGLFKWVSSLHQVAKVLEFQLQHQSFQWTPRTDLL